jgi:hypothetical protein
LNVARAAVIAAALALAASAAPAGAATPRCTPRALASARHTKVIARDSATLVYRVRGDSQDTIWACHRGGTRRRTLVGHDDSVQNADNEYGPDEPLSGLQLQGDFVLAIQTTDANSVVICEKYQQGDCSGPNELLVVVDAAHHRRGQVAQIVGDTAGPTQDTSVAWPRVLLSPLGLVAWLQTTMTHGLNVPASGSTTLYGCRLAPSAGNGLACPPQTLGQGTIDPASLAFSGAVLSWTEGGEPQSATL